MSAHRILISLVSMKIYMLKFQLATLKLDVRVWNFEEANGDHAYNKIHFWRQINLFYFPFAWPDFV